MRKIGTKSDCETLWGLPPPVYKKIEETIWINVNKVDRKK
jgi:hypothetical protein